MTSMTSALSHLLQKGAVWRGDSLAHCERPGLPSGFEALDHVLPGQGWPIGALTEILHSDSGIGELALILRAIAAQTRQGQGVALINPPYGLYAPAWAAQDVRLEHCLVIRPVTAKDMLWSAEQCLRSGACGLVLIWEGGHGVAYKHLRRLQTAADTGHTAGLVLRDARVASAASPASLRLQLRAAADRLAVYILKRRGVPLTEPVLLPVHSRACAAWQDLYEDAPLPDAPRSTRHSLQPRLDTGLEHATRAPGDAESEAGADTERRDVA